MANKGCRPWDYLGSRLRRPAVLRLRERAPERPREPQPRVRRAPPAAHLVLPLHRLGPRVSRTPPLLSDRPALLPSAPVPRLLRLALPVPRRHLSALRDLRRLGAAVRLSATR